MRFKHFFLIIILFFLGGSLLLGILWWRSGNWRETVFQQVGGQLVNDQAQLTFFHELLGFDSPQTYLILFLNNTEMRPGGGFIGTYAVVKVDKSVPSILKTEGTEILDYSTDNNDLPASPRPIKDYLLVNKWFFRDSNWYPDFKLSSEKGLELYKLEKGLEADNINHVVAITPNIIERILRIIGPVTVRNEVVTADNFLEKVQYEVEYGYVQKGVTKADRKGFLADLTKVVLEKVKVDMFLHWTKYFDLGKSMMTEKQMVFYSTNPEIQKVLKLENWSGEMQNPKGDYLLWADANMGALKTDLVMKKTLSYEIVSTSTDKYIATVKMKYSNEGTFDWRTSRYRDYARVYVPLGAKLVNVAGSMKKEKSQEPGIVEQGEEGGKQWFGTFIAIEPGKTGELSFSYLLPESVVEQIKSGEYSLLLQKQIGSNGVQVKLKLNFNQPLSSAVPGEQVENYGDSVYDVDTDLSMDRYFEVKLK